MNFVACGPEECMPADDVIEACKPIAEANGCTIKLTTDVKDLSLIHISRARRHTMPRRSCR